MLHFKTFLFSPAVQYSVYFQPIYSSVYGGGRCELRYHATMYTQYISRITIYITAMPDSVSWGLFYCLPPPPAVEYRNRKEYNALLRVFEPPVHCFSSTEESYKANNLKYRLWVLERSCPPNGSQKLQIATELVPWTMRTGLSFPRGPAGAQSL